MPECADLTRFIGILVSPYHETPEDKMPQEIHYAYFILHLQEMKASGEYTAAEDTVLEQLAVGAVGLYQDYRTYAFRSSVLASRAQ